MCKAAEMPNDPLPHLKPQYLIAEQKKLPVTQQGISDSSWSLRSLLSVMVTVSVAPTRTSDLLRLLAATTLTVMACLLVSYSLFGWFGPLIEASALLAEDLGALALLLLLWLLAGRLQRRTDASPPRSPRKKAQSVSLEDGYDANGYGGSSRQRRAQWRRQCLRRAFDQLRDVVRSVNAGASGDAADQKSPRCSVRANVTPCGLHNFHTAARGFLLPVEVAACQYAPDVSKHLQRLLEDQWAILAAGGFPAPLASIPE